MDEIDAADVDVADLPGTLRELAALIGLPATLTLIRHYGGVRLYIPKTLEPGHILVRLLGPEAAQRLVAHYLPGENFDVPRGQSLVRALRDRAIAAAAARGASSADLARGFGMTHRHVRRILHRADPVDMQPGLFE
jgi:hypothetical protein